MIIAIHYNSEHLIEKYIDKNVLDSLLDLKENRHDECHYMNNTYTRSQINDREYVMYEKIKKIDHDVKKTFDSKYPGLIDEIEYLMKQHTLNTPSQKSINNIIDWWEDY